MVYLLDVQVVISIFSPTLLHMETSVKEELEIAGSVLQCKLLPKLVKSQTISWTWVPLKLESMEQDFTHLVFQLTLELMISFFTEATIPNTPNKEKKENIGLQSWRKHFPSSMEPMPVLLVVILQEASLTSLDLQVNIFSRETTCLKRNKSKTNGLECMMHLMQVVCLPVVHLAIMEVMTPKTIMVL